MAKTPTTKFNLTAALKASRGLRKEAQQNPVASGYETFDDGRYLLRGKAFSIGQSQSGRLQACIEFTFLDGDYRGKTFRHYQGLDRAEGWGYLEADLRRMDVWGDDGPDFDTEQGVAKFAKAFAKERPIVWGKLRTKGEFQNLRIDRLATDEDPDDYETVNSDDDNEAADEPVKKSSKTAAKKPSKKDDDEDDDAIANEEDEASDDSEEADDSDDSDDADDADDSDSEDEVVEEDDADDDTIAVSVGATVIMKTSDGKKTGEVLEIYEKDNKLKVKATDGKTYKLSADRILSVKELPKKAAKPAPKPVAKKKR